MPLSPVRRAHRPHTFAHRWSRRLVAHTRIASHTVEANEVLELARDDLVGLWEVIRVVPAAGPSTSSIPERVLALVHDLLTSGMLKAGVPDVAGGFKAWPGSPDEIVARIRDHWRDLGRVPDIGDIVRFAGTSILVRARRPGLLATPSPQQRARDVSLP